MSEDSKPELVFSTPVADCPACAEKRLHTTEDWKHHPYVGHGMTREQGWSHPDLKPERDA